MCLEINPTGRAVLALGTHVPHTAATALTVHNIHRVRTVRGLSVFAQRLRGRRAEVTLLARVEKAFNFDAAARGATIARWLEVSVQGGEVAGELGVGVSREGAVVAGQQQHAALLLLQVEGDVVGLAAVVLRITSSERVGLSAFQSLHEEKKTY